MPGQHEALVVWHLPGAEAVRQGSGQGRAGPGPGAAPRTGPPPLGGGQVATARGSAGGRQSGSNS